MVRDLEEWLEEIEEAKKALRLTMARLKGILNSWIRGRIQKATPDQLWATERDLIKWAKERGREEKVPSKGKMYQEWSNHPLNRLLFEERIRREHLLESNDPRGYLNPLHDLSEVELKDYLQWKAEKHGPLEEWRKHKKRSLTVISSNIVGDEAKEDNRGLFSSREGGQLSISHRQAHLKGPTLQKEETKAYPPRGKRA